MNRRSFFRNSVIAGAFFSSGYLSRYLIEKKASLISGEEWRNDRKVNRSDLIGLADDQEVLDKALANIEQHRKIEFEVQIADKQGSPIPNQEVTVEQLDHEFDWGFSSAGTKSGLVYSKESEKAEHISRLFNCTTAKCYWNERWHQPIEKYKNVRIYNLFQEEVAWAKELGLRVKGHPLIWSVKKAIPEWLFSYPYDKQLEFLKIHVQSLIEVGGDAITKWDLCNEMLWEPAFKNIAKRQWPHIDPIEEIAEYIALGLEWAREVNPDASYALNDYGLVLTYIDEISAAEQRERYLQLIEELKDRNALPDAVGCQAHIGGRFPLAAFERAVNELASAGLPVQITEFWTKVKDYPNTLSASELEQAMAKYVANIYTLAFSHPSVSHFTYWGGNDVFFNDEGEPTLVYERLYELIRNKWTSKLSIQTDTEGKLKFRAFAGAYNFSLGAEKTSGTLNQSEPKLKLQLI